MLCFQSRLHKACENFRTAETAGRQETWPLTPDELRCHAKAFAQLDCKRFIFNRDFSKRAKLFA
jgi:hypothetical protein